ncbi:RDD family protein [Mariniblastus fucicola]|uniref:RDD family protein n=1 Tax=Mariniblastus fucicola TaxID=980251 RepID=A0A5B9PD76_9BACT|nr:RDD family protein [Mariniblastus fucicola]QEG22526.1 RDD family protein [Mariniblastus fucicola]
MSLIVACPNCQTRYNLPEKFQGKKIKCKSCGKPFSATFRAASGAAATPSQAAQRAASVDPQELNKMGIGAIKRQADPFAAPAYNGPDPLRNHVVQDPGFGMPGQMRGQENENAEESDLDPDYASVVSNPYIQTLPKGPAAGSKPKGQSGKRLRNASLGKRFGTNFIDGLFMQLLGVPIGMGCGFVLPPEIAPLIALLLSMVFFLGYYILLEATCGRTIGKMLFGTKVVSEDGSRATFLQVVGRTFCRMIPFEPFSFFFGDTGSGPSGWHDSLPGTRVIEG